MPGWMSRPNLKAACPGSLPHLGKGLRSWVPEHLIYPCIQHAGPQSPLSSGPPCLCPVKLVGVRNTWSARQNVRCPDLAFWDQRLCIFNRIPAHFLSSLRIMALMELDLLILDGDTESQGREGKGREGLAQFTQLGLELVLGDKVSQTPLANRREEAGHYLGYLIQIKRKTWSLCRKSRGNWSLLLAQPCPVFRP